MNTGALQVQTLKERHRFSGGSGAHVRLMDNGRDLFIRKQAYGKGRKSLIAQMKWLQYHENTGRVPKVLRWEHAGGAFSYDMEYLSSCRTFYEFQGPADLKENLLFEVLAQVTTMQIPLSMSDKQKKERLQKLLQEKVLKNLEEWEGASASFSRFSRNPKMTVNGTRVFHWRKLVSDFLSHEKLLGKMIQEPFVRIHGDLTFSNILIDPKGRFFIIDPNPENVFSTPSMEFSKLMQSSFIGYESLEKIRRADVSPPTGTITYPFPQASPDPSLENLRKKFLPGVEDGVLYGHLAIHMARILPYRWNKPESQKWIYFGEFLKCLELALK